MISASDTGNMVYLRAMQMGIPVYQDGTLPSCNVIEGPMVVLHPKEQTWSGRWRQNFIDVNILVPDFPDRRADLASLNEWERTALSALPHYGYFNNVPYLCEVYSSGVLAAPDLKCHYANIKLLFKVLNITE